MVDDRSQDLMGYAAMEQEASRGVVKAALKRAARPDGLPGGHHLYITFRTAGHGVSVPPELLARYPEEMTIVLQHQFWDLAPGETFFAVTLKFGGEPKKLSVPYTAITRFYDPSVQYLLQFDPPPGGEADGAAEGEHEVVPLRPRPAETPPATLPRPAARERDRKGAANAAPAVATPTPPAEPPPETPPEGGEPPPDGPKIVSLDKFRKK